MPGRRWGAEGRAAFGFAGVRWAVALAALGLSVSALPGDAAATPVVQGTSVASRATVHLAAAGTSAPGKPLGWFAGWTLDGRVFNRTALLTAKGAATPAAIADAHAAIAPASAGPAAPRGHALVFFATWCKPCEAGLRELAAAQPRWTAAGLDVVLVAVGEDAATVTPWLAARPELAPLTSAATVLPDRFGVVGRDLAGIGADAAVRSSLPRTVVTDAAGVVRAVLGAEGEDYVAVVLAAAGP